MPVKSVNVELFAPVIKVVLHDLAGRDVQKTGLRVFNRAKVMCPVDEGNLRAGHQYKVRQTETKVIAEVSNRVKYALAVHEGRRAVTIYPKNKKALSFVWHGQKMVRKSVHQPARRGRPWMRTALTEVAGQQGYKMESVPSSDGSM